MRTNYKKKYNRAVAIIWIMFLGSLFFFWNIHSILNTMEKDIQAFGNKQQAEIYIEAGWMPPYELLTGEDLNK